jgi:hypothetical protein
MDHQHKNIMQTSEAQRPKTEMETKIQCSITKVKCVRGEVQFHKIQTEMEHLQRDTKMQHVRDVPTKGF